MVDVQQQVSKGTKKDHFWKEITIVTLIFNSKLFCLKVRINPKGGDNQILAKSTTWRDKICLLKVH